MVFRNILLAAVFIAATAFAQPADSTTNKNVASVAQQSLSPIAVKSTTTSLKKQQKVLKATTWSKIKDLFE